MSASAVVAAADDAARAADAEATVPQSDEVRAEESGGSKPEAKAATQDALRRMTEPAPQKVKAAKPKAKSTKAATGKYSPELKAAAKRAEELRKKPRSCGPVQVQRAQKALSKYGNEDPMEIVKAFKSINGATLYAGGDKGVKQPAVVAELSKKIDDPFARGRGLVAICLALAGR